MARRCKAIRIAGRFEEQSERGKTQWHPVVVYVPKLRTADGRIDSEELGSRSWQDLKDAVTKEGDEEDRDIDESIDVEALSARLLLFALRDCLTAS